MWRELWFDSRSTKIIQALIAQGSVEYDAYKGLLVARTEGNFDSPWLFVGNTQAARCCFLWHEIMFNKFNLVPEFCRFYCWKVVVKLRTVVELIQFYQLMQAIPFLYGYLAPIHGKAGIDPRDYSSNPYNAFFYCNSRKEGLIKWSVVRHACNSYMYDGPQIPVILKKSCTEMEGWFGPTNQEQWQTMSTEEYELQRKLEDIFSVPVNAAWQPDWQVNRTVLMWIRFAAGRGDRSGLDMLPEDKITVHSVTYHNGVDDRQVRDAATNVRLAHSAGPLHDEPQPQQEAENGTGNNENPSPPQIGAFFNPYRG